MFTQTTTTTTKYYARLPYSSEACKMFFRLL